MDSLIYVTYDVTVLEDQIKFQKHSIHSPSFTLHSFYAFLF